MGKKRKFIQDVNDIPVKSLKRLIMRKVIEEPKRRNKYHKQSSNLLALLKTNTIFKTAYYRIIKIIFNHKYICYNLCLEAL